MLFSQIKIVLLAVLWAVSMGCGTIQTVRDPRLVCGEKRVALPIYIYSGVRCDVAYLRSDYNPDGQGGFWAVLDTPLSLVADTVLLPWRIFQHFRQDDLDL